MSSASRQLALALFADLSQRDEGVEQAPADLGFRRNNALINISDLSLAGRRLVDVAHFIAAEDSEIHKEYRVDLGLFRWLLGTTSRNSRHLQKIIREAQQGAIVLDEIDLADESKDWFGSVPLLGAAFVRNGEFTFDLSERLQVAIKNPATYHFLSLRYVFKSIHSKVLYDRLQKHLDEGITPWLTIQQLRKWMECETKTYDLFKHFRNKVLDVAISEIREVAKLHIEMQTQNVPGSKRIGQVRFKFEQLQNGTKDEQKTELIVLRSLYETLRSEFALSQAEFNEILTNRELYTDERIQQAIDYTRHNHALGKVKLRAGGYFMKALREGYLVGTLDKQMYQRVTDASAAKAAADKEAAEREARSHAAAAERDKRMADLGWDAYEQLTPAEQSAAMADFCQSPAAKLLARSLDIELSALREHLSEPTVRSSFGTFVAGRVQKAARAAKQAGASSADAKLI